MSALPLDVHEVLEQEYVSRHGRIDVPPSRYGPKDVVDEPWARKILTECGLPATGSIVDTLNDLVGTLPADDKSAMPLSAEQLKKLSM